MPPPGQTGSWRHCVLSLSICLSIRASVTCSACERNILKTNEQFFMPVGTNGPLSTGMKRSTLGSGSKGHGRTRLKVDLEVCRRHDSRPSSWVD